MDHGKKIRDSLNDYCGGYELKYREVFLESCVMDRIC